MPPFLSRFVPMFGWVQSVSHQQSVRASHGLAHGASPGERASGRAESELMMGLRYITHYTVFLPQPMLVKGTHSKETHTTRSAPLAPHRIRSDRARLSDLARLHASVTSCLDAPALTVDAAHGSLQKDSLSLSQHACRHDPTSHFPSNPRMNHMPYLHARKLPPTLQGCLSHVAPDCV